MKQGELLLRAFEDAAKQWGEDEKIGDDARTSSRLLGRFRQLRRKTLAYIDELELRGEGLTKILDEKNARINDLKAQVAELRESETDLKGRLTTVTQRLNLFELGQTAKTHPVLNPRPTGLGGPEGG